MFEVFKNKYNICNMPLQQLLGKVFLHPDVGRFVNDTGYIKTYMYQDDLIKVIYLYYDGPEFSASANMELYYKGILIYKTHECDKTEKYREVYDHINAVIKESEEIKYEREKKRIKEQIKHENDKHIIDIITSSMILCECNSNYFRKNTFENDKVKVIVNNIGYEDPTKDSSLFSVDVTIYVNEIGIVFDTHQHYWRGGGENRFVILNDSKVYRQGSWEQYIIEISKIKEKELKRKELQQKKIRLEKERQRKELEKLKYTPVDDAYIFDDNYYILKK